MNKELADSIKRLEEANYALQSEKTRELEEINAHLSKANDELSRSNESLETEVRERIRAENSLKEAVVKRDEFLAMLSHELRNPLSPLRNASHMLMQGETQDPKIIWSRGVIARQLKHMIRLVDDLLDVSRIARGKIVLRERAGEDRGRAGRGRRDRAAAAGAEDASTWRSTRRIRSSRCAATRCGWRRWSATCCTTPRSTRARAAISCSRRVLTDRRAEILVRDTGIGIASEAMPRIFELFTQIPSERVSTTGGLGIGLALVRALVELHGGEIRVASAGVDLGSEFTVRLPLLGASEHASESKVAAEKSESPLPVRRNILIADDNQDALESLALMLRMEGHEVHCASDGEEALLLAGLRRPEIVVLDVGMPKLDGCEVARRIRAESWGRGAVLVALTGWGQEIDRRRSREAGFDMHLVKPVDPATLCDMLVAQ